MFYTCDRVANITQSRHPLFSLYVKVHETAKIAPDLRAQKFVGSVTLSQEKQICFGDSQQPFKDVLNAV